MPLHTCALHMGVNLIHLSCLLDHFSFFPVFFFLFLLTRTHIYGCHCAHVRYKRGTIPSPPLLFLFFVFCFPFFSFSFFEVRTTTDATVHMCNTNGESSHHLHFFLRFFFRLFSHTHLLLHLHTLSQRLFSPRVLFPFFKKIHIYNATAHICLTNGRPSYRHHFVLSEFLFFSHIQPLRTFALQMVDYLIASISFCLVFFSFFFFFV